MRVFRFLFLLGICVVYLSQNVGGIQNIKGPQRNLDTEAMESFEDFDEPTIIKLPTTNHDHCHEEFELCEKDLYDFNKRYYYDAKPICVYKKSVGLTNFFGLCAIKLEYCLMTDEEKDQDSSASPGDSHEIYHNGYHFDCLYYGHRVKSEKEGIIWYFKLGGLNAETEEIMQPFKIDLVNK